MIVEFTSVNGRRGRHRCDERADISGSDTVDPNEPPCRLPPLLPPLLLPLLPRPPRLRLQDEARIDLVVISASPTATSSSLSCPISPTLSKHTSMFSRMPLISRNDEFTMHRIFRERNEIILNKFQRSRDIKKKFYLHREGGED